MRLHSLALAGCCSLAIYGFAANAAQAAVTMNGYEACSVQYSTNSKGERYVVNGCTPNYPGATTGYHRMAQKIFNTMADCQAAAAAVAVQDPPYTYGICHQQ